MSKKSGKNGKVRTNAQKTLAKAALGNSGISKPLVYGPVAKPSGKKPDEAKPKKP
ncbi:hypothetical protein ES708_05894 [subsurface metagenome]